MSETKNAQDYAAFLESLKVNNELPKEMNGFNMSAPVERLRRNNNLNRDAFKGNKDVLHFCDLVDVLLVRVEIAESNAKPSDLAEQVKKFMRARMDAERKARKFPSGHVDLIGCAIAQEFRRATDLINSKDLEIERLKRELSLPWEMKS